MKLTVYSDYALRVLMYLALNDDRLCTIQEIADQHKISKNHLMKLVFELAKEGYIHSVRGRTGGIELGTTPDKIRLGELVRFTEGDFDIVECFDMERNTCVINGACRLKSVLREATKAFLVVLDSYTLEDLMKNKNALRKALELV